MEALHQLQERLARFHQQTPRTMENLISAIVDLQKILEDAGIPSALIGGLAVGVWGEPKLTRDVDLKVLAWRDERACVLQVLSHFSIRPRDRQDIEGIVKRQGNRLDDRYIENWLHPFEQALHDSTLVSTAVFVGNNSTLR